RSARWSGYAATSWAVPRHGADVGRGRRGRAGRPTGARPARGAHRIEWLETALCDAAARFAGVSLAGWLGGPAAPEPTTVYANINRAVRDRTPEECARVTAAAVADGFGAVRIAPFDFLRERSDRAVYGVELAMAVREAIGP